MTSLKYFANITEKLTENSAKMLFVNAVNKHIKFAANCQMIWNFVGFIYIGRSECKIYTCHDLNEKIREIGSFFVSNPVQKEKKPKYVALATDYLNCILR